MKHKWENLVKAKTVLNEVLIYHNYEIVKNWDDMSEDELQAALTQYANQIALAIEHLDNISV